QVVAGPIPAGTRFRRHAHEGVHVCCVLEGGFVESRRDGWEDVGPGTVRVSPSSAHDIDFAPNGARCLVISRDGEPPAPARSVYLRDPWLLRLVAGLGRAARRGDAAAPLAFEEQLDELLAQIARRRGARAFREPPPWLVTARVRVREAEGRV